MESPDFEIPLEGIYLWEWYGEVSHSMQRVSEGVCRPIPPTEWIAWMKLTGNIVNHIEYDILSAMDKVFCEETNVELENANIRRQESYQKELDARGK